MIETKFKDAILFVPVCANCGVAVVNRDQIEAGQYVTLTEREGAEPQNKKYGKYLPWKANYYEISPCRCPRCHTEFDKVVVPFKVENIEDESE